MSSDTVLNHTDWKDCVEFLCSERTEIILTVLNLDFCGSSEIIEKDNNFIAHEFLENSRNAIDKIFEVFKNDIAKGSWHGDSIVVVFKETVKAISAAQRIIRNLRWGNIKLSLRMAVDKNTIIFKKDIGRSTSKALIYTKRLREKYEEENIIIITEAIYDFLNPKMRDEFKYLGSVKIEKPNKSIIAYSLSFEPRKLITFIVNSKGEIKNKFPKDEATKTELEEIGLSPNVLSFAQKLCEKGKKVILIEQSDQPIISAMALHGSVDKEKMIKEKIYKSSSGYDVYWEQEVQFPHPIGIETDYDWILEVKQN